MRLDIDWKAIGAVVGIVILSFWLGAVFGGGFIYGYNQTEQQKQEEKFLPYCYSNKSLVIEQLKDYCNEIYGGPVD